MGFRRSEATYRALAGGIASGKSYALCYDLIRRAKRKRLYMVTAATYPMLRDATLRTFRKIAQDLNYERSFHRGDMVITLGNRADVLFRSTDDPDRLRGPNLSGVAMDEASLSSEEAYMILIGRLREEGEQGWLSAAFTPQGRSHWTYSIFGGEGTDGAELFHARTRDNPFLPAGFHDRLALQYGPARAAQELEGLFVDLEGAEWPAAWFDEAAMWFDDWPSPRLTHCRVVALDPSKGKDAKHGDYSAFVMLAFCRDGTLYVDADLDRRNTSVIEDTGLLIDREFQPDAFGIEGNFFQDLLGDNILRRASEAGRIFPLWTIINDIKKEVRIRRLTPYLSARRMRFKADSRGAAMLVNQLREFPTGQHEDGPDALEMAVRLVGELLGHTEEVGMERVR